MTLFNRSSRATALFTVTGSLLAGLTLSTGSYAQDEEAAVEDDGADIGGGADDRAGPLMVNLKVGPAIGIAEFSGFNAFGLELEAGYAVLENHAYITFSPNFAFGDLTLITLPLGFQYEIELPVDNLYAYGRATLGVGFVTEGGDPAFHVGPHLGAKYQITDMIHVGADALSFPIYFNDKGAAAQYRFMAYGGVDLDI